MTQETNFSEEVIYCPEALRHFFFFIQDKKHREKIVVGLTQKNHITLHFGTKSKILDLHYTDESFPEGDCNRSRTLLSIPYDIGEQLVKYLEEVMPYYILKYYASTRINLSKLGRHNCILTKMDATAEELGGFVKLKHRRISFGKSIEVEKLLALYVSPEEISTVRSGNQFNVYKVKKTKLIHQGFIWYPPYMHGRKPFFVSRKQFNEMCRLVKVELFTKYQAVGGYFNAELWNELTLKN